MKPSLSHTVVASMAAMLALGCDEDATVNEDLPRVTTTLPYDIEADRAVSGGDITDEGASEVTLRGVCWSPNPDPTVTDDCTDEGGGTGSFTSTLTGLDPGATYHVRAYATNTAGTGYGAEEVFTTVTGTITGTGDPGLFTDPRDGNVYATTTIGAQHWMAENLRYLPEVHNNDAFAQRESPGYGVFGYDGDSVAEAEAHPNYDLYGVMYNWYAATAACPAGWHLPSSGEWAELESFVDGDGHADLAGTALKATSGWGCGYPGTDDYGFTALAGGVRSYGDGAYFDPGLYTNFWASTPGNGYLAYYRELACSHNWLVESASGHRSAGNYVRCVQD